MPSTDTSVRERRAVQDWLARARGWLSRLPLWLRIVAVLAFLVCVPPALPILLLAGLAYAPIAVITERRSGLASVCVALWGWLAVTLAAGGMSTGLMVLFALALLVAAAAHQGILNRCYVPCRTTAWALLWSMPVGGLALRLWPAEPYIGVAVAVLLAALVLCWRLAKAWQEMRGYGQGQVRAQALAAPHGQAVRSSRAMADGGETRHPAPVPARGPRPAEREEPDISVGEAMAELD